MLIVSSIHFLIILTETKTNNKKQHYLYSDIQIFFVFFFFLSLHQDLFGIIDLKWHWPWILLFHRKILDPIMHPIILVRIFQSPNCNNKNDNTKWNERKFIKETRCKTPSSTNTKILKYKKIISIILIRILYIGIPYANI